MKAYILACAVVILWIVMFGFILPSLLSANDDFTVAVGFALLLATFPVSFLLVRKLVNTTEVQALLRKLKEPAQ